ncbi:hypothetical protein [Azospirillum thermophilum]|uniref:hypothetical protein n=1 Tax=Azospirillum thermophilum TaxID=2202148 RepID=UPI00143DEEE7|nr:hypothetical protein [Azospirillum thermophilum]
MRTKWPFGDMEIGDSFLAAGVPSANAFGGRVVAATYRTGFKFTMRRVEGGVRVWRVG